MRITTAFIVIAGLAGLAPAYAQGTAPSLPSKPPGQATVGAPPGHRQPRPSDIPPPPERATTDMAPTGSVTNPRPDANDAEARLNRALHGVCRGC